MKKSARIFTFLSFLILPSRIWANSVSINVKSNVQTNSSSTTHVSSSTNSKIDINQKGDGTSRVVINGKEYKVEGPGELHINESSNQPTSPPSTSAPTTPSNPTNTLTPPPAPSLTLTPPPSPTPPNLDELVEELEEKQTTFFEEMKTLLLRLTNLLKNFAPQA